MATIEITWQNREAKGWVDVIPTDWFERDHVNDFAVKHTCDGTGKGKSCYVKTSRHGLIGFIDYAGSERSRNKRVYIGQTLIVFSCIGSIIPVDVLWRDDDEHRYHDSVGPAYRLACDFAVKGVIKSSAAPPRS